MLIDSTDEKEGEKKPDIIDQQQTENEPPSEKISEKSEQGS